MPSAMDSIPDLHTIVVNTLSAGRNITLTERFSLLSSAHGVGFTTLFFCLALSLAIN